MMMTNEDYSKINELFNKYGASWSIEQNSGCMPVVHVDMALDAFSKLVSENCTQVSIETIPHDIKPTDTIVFRFQYGNIDCETLYDIMKNTMKVLKTKKVIAVPSDVDLTACSKTELEAMKRRIEELIYYSDFDNVVNG